MNRKQSKGDINCLVKKEINEHSRYSRPQKWRGFIARMFKPFFVEKVKDILTKCSPHEDFLKVAMPYSKFQLLPKIQNDGRSLFRAKKLGS